MFEVVVKKDGEEIGIARGETLVDAVNRLVLMFDLNDIREEKKK